MHINNTLKKILTKLQVFYVSILFMTVLQGKFIPAHFTDQETKRRR